MGLERSPSNRLGPYALGERLGVGGMAEVYLAESAGPHGFTKRVALKRILPQLSQDPRFVAMFCDEAKICAMLEHPNIVKVIDFGESGGELFMAMEYVDGISGARLLRAVSARGERFPLGAVLYIAHEILRALAHAHEASDERGRPLNIVHRDVSPGNVLIGREGEVKLTDFGIVRSAFVDRRTHPGELKGKLGYMSPEQVMGEDLDPRSDLFTAAIIIAELCLVRPLFPGQNELEILTRTHRADLEVLERFGNDVPRLLLKALKQALSASVGGRFQSAREFLAAIREVARAEGLPLNADQLVPWMSSLGVLGPRSGAHDLSSARAYESGARIAVAEVSSPSASGTRHKAQDTLVDFEEAATEVGGRYWLRLPETDAATPVELSELLERVATGRLPLDIEVSRDGERYSPIRCFPEFARFARRQAYSFVDGSPPEWSLQLLRRELPTLLFHCGVQRLTGLIRVDAARSTHRLFIVDGRPRFVASSDSSTLFGERLVRANLLAREQLPRLLAIGSETGERLGRVCVAENLLAPEVVEQQLTEQLEARLAVLGGLSEAVVSFVPGVRSGEYAPSAKAPLLQWVSRLVQASYSPGEVRQYLVPCLDQRLSPGGLRLAPSELGLSGPLRRVLHFACGGETLSGLVRSLRDERIAQQRETFMAAFLGLSAGFLRAPGFVDPLARLGI